MNITKEEIRTLRKFLSKEERLSIAEQTGRSVYSVEHTLQGLKENDKIQRIAFTKAKENFNKIGILISEIELKNKL